MLIPKTILHVDDDPTMLRLVSRILSTAETTVVSLSEPLLAIERMAQIRPNIIILDIDMPDKDGMTLLQEIKKIDISIPVIMCTGMVSINTLLKATQFGADACVFKPINDFSKLRKAVERASNTIDQRWLDMQEWVARNGNSTRYTPPVPTNSNNSAFRSSMQTRTSSLVRR